MCLSRAGSTGGLGAPSARGNSMSGFILQAATKAAEATLAVEHETLVPAGSFDELLAALDAPDSGTPVLDDWLCRFACRADAANTGRTFVWTEPGSSTVVAYFTLVAHSVRRDEVPRFPRSVIVVGRGPRRRARRR
ncbi:MAG: type II toxin -antitoxin system TacA 1-like antitoxin [Acidimicrobiales bacterium]